MSFSHSGKKKALFEKKKNKGFFQLREKKPKSKKKKTCLKSQSELRTVVLHSGDRQTSLVRLWTFSSNHHNSCSTRSGDRGVWLTTGGVEICKCKSSREKRKREKNAIDASIAILKSLRCSFSSSPSARLPFSTPCLLKQKSRSFSVFRSSPSSA